MARLFCIITAVAVSIGCSAETATKEREATPPTQAVAVPGTSADRGIRRHLTLAIARDADLKNREISFIVANGDVSVTGIVGTEEERRKINALAMSIDGVKSVANALRVAEAE